MPTYEYRCPEGHEFEQFQRMSDPPEATCPKCGATAQRLLSGGAGLIFRGSGFYLTDYRSESYRKAAEADAKGGTTSGSESGSGSTGATGGSSGEARSSESSGSQKQGKEKPASGGADSKSSGSGPTAGGKSSDS